MDTATQSYGQSLPDQVERIAALFDAHLGMISDVRDLYRDRVLLEREYATRLQALAKKAAEKRSRNEAPVVVGEDPTKSWDGNTLRQNSLSAAYNEIISSTLNAAQDHVNIADALTSQVVDVLKAVERKSEDTKKKEIQFFQKLLAERDRTYTERLKSKQKYDEECVEADSHRQKQGRTLDDKQAERLAKQAEQQRNDMLNSKNVYLIATAIANKAKGKFYGEDLPKLEDQFQLLQTRLVERFTKILLHTQALQVNHLDVLKSRLNQAEATIAQINPSKDQSLFIEYNIRPFTAPGDWSFEPCATHYDTDAMSIEPAPKVFLQNKLSRSRSKLQELVPLIQTKRRDLDQLSKLVMSYTAEPSLGNIDEVSDGYLEAVHQLVFLCTSEQTLEAEIASIVAAIGDDEGAQQPHAFKSSSFSIPTQCGYCRSSIWGLSKQGKTCKLCNLSVHSKCELKVPADCQRSEGGRQSNISQRKPPKANEFLESSPIQSPATSPITPSESPPVYQHASPPVAHVLYDFTPTTEFEIGISQGSIVRVLELDDGSGWTKVVDNSGASGLVPASYLEHESPARSGAAPQQGSGQYVRAIYKYESRGNDEIGLNEGELVELSSGLTGGQGYGNDWWEGINSKGRKGIFPSNYVEIV